MEVKITQEYLSSDIIDEDFLRTFLVLYRIQYAMSTCRIDIKNKFATPPTIAQRVYTIICILLVTASNYAIGKDYISKVQHAIIRYLGLASLALQYLLFISNITHVRFLNNKENVEFHVKMQKLDRLLKIDQWKVLYQWARNSTNIPLALICLSFSILLIYAGVEHGMACLFLLGPAFSILALIFELTACTCMIAYFVFRMRFINSLVDNHLSPETKDVKAKRFISKSFLKYYSQKTNNYFETCDTHIYLRELFVCFKMYQNLYRFQLFTFCIQAVAASLLTFELLLYSMQNNISSLLESSIYIVFTVLDVFGAVFLSIRYEMFFDEVNETKRLCINVLARHVDGPIREKARKMLKIINETPPRFSVYEMWEMNASTFVTMFALITSLVLTSLQFEFL